MLPHLDQTHFDDVFFTRRFSESLDRVRIACFESPLGFTLLTDGNIDMFFVAPSARGSGVGTTMLRDAEAHGAKQLECFAANGQARGFYERRGWRLAATYARPYGGTDCDFVRYVKP